MRANIHPTYYPDAKVTCASCGNTWTTGSTRKEIRVDICSNCHPFFTGESQRILDIEGQVDRFYKKLSARQTYVEQQKVKEDCKNFAATLGIIDFQIKDIGDKSRDNPTNQKTAVFTNDGRTYFSDSGAKTKYNIIFQIMGDSHKFF